MVGKEKSWVDLVLEKSSDFDGSELHWIASYYDIGLVVKHPNPEIEKQKAEQRRKNRNALNLMVQNGTLEDIKEIIRKGRIGYTYKS